MTNELYFFDDNQQLLKILGNEEILENIQKKEITTNKSDLMNDSLSVVVKENDAIQDAAFMAVRENETSFSMYKIISDDDSNNRLSFTGINFAPDELSSYIVKDIRPNAESFRSVAQRLLDFTEGEWSIGYLDSSLNAVTGTFYYVSVKDAMKTLQTLGCEITFSCTVTSSGIEDKQVNFYNQIGKESDMRFDYGSNALEVVRERNRSQIYTSLIGRGKGEEVGDGYGRRIEFTDIEWKKSAGKPLDKPLGQNWLEYPEMTALFGIPKKDGTMRKRENVLVLEDIEDQEELLQATYENLMEYSRPFVQFKTKVLGGDDIGNYVTIHRPEKGYHYRTRVFSVTLDRKAGKVESGLGDNLSGSSSDRKLANIASGVSELNQNKMTFYQSTEIGKYQDDIMRGAGINGGSIYQVNGIEAGVSDSREIYETVYMDGPKISESEHFMIQNSEGISFKQCEKGEWTTIQDVHNGASNTAWTLDGTLVANFIKAGILSGILVQGVALKTLDDDDFQVVMEGGGVFFERQVQSTGLDDVHGEQLGRIVATYGSSHNINGFAVIQKPGYIFSINTNSTDPNSNSSKAVFQIPADSTPDLPLFNLFGKGKLEGALEITERLDVNELFVNGVKIDTNGGGTGGGGWNGQYPPELTTDMQKRAWQVYQMALGFGYTKQAAAGLLGNMQQESNISPTASENSSPGYGYGLVQWTDSSGTSTGRNYMLGLMNKAGITDDPDSITAQMKLVEWHSQNGQWIATSAYPYSYSQFKELSDIQTATMAFLRNFERAGVEAAGNRVQWANDWYNLFKDLKNPGTGGYALPVREGTPVTSWFGPRWGTMHNGIDFGAPLGDPIFASKDGTVVQSMPTSASGGFGEYIIIQHDDGYMSGYAHMTTRMKQVGDVVSQGQRIGTCGSTGDSTGPHLHFSIQTGTWGPYVDPAPFLGLTPP